ncbi:hypothetical protein CRM75_01695 [Enterococcus faecium]|nr:hypothetical protein CRM75_01695 [Enterococcus faecium]
MVLPKKKPPQKIIEIGKIYYCSIPEVKGNFEVQVLEKKRYKGYIVRVIRCTLQQRKILKELNYRFVVRAAYLLEMSQNF